jgi:DNA-binding XRE family transcriptional regulator
MFGVRLSELGLQQNRLAELGGVSPKTVFDWVHGSSDPLISYAYAVALGLGYDVDDLAGDVPLGSPRREPVPQQLEYAFKSTGRTKFGVAFRQLVEREGVSLRELAPQIGAHDSTLGRWLGDREPKLFWAHRTARVFGLSLHAMCEGKLVRR